jgi:hypothetical protein
MKSILLLLVACAVPGAAETLPERYASYGELIVTPLASAPFPHPSRAEGHKYKEQFFDAKEHYADSTVAIFVPRGFRENGKVDFVVHFHGWNNHVEKVLTNHMLIEQFVDSGRNAVLIVPQGPRNASDSAGGKLEDAGGFKRFIAEVMNTLRDKSGLNRKDFVLGNVILSGHSGAYKVISSIVESGGLTDRIREVWLFDGLYAEMPKFLVWAQAQPQGRWIDIYTQNGGTKKQSEYMMKTLKERGTSFYAGTEADVKPSDLLTQHMVFLYSDLTHNEVVAKRQEFREYLKTSFLSERRKSWKE